MDKFQLSRLPWARLFKLTGWSCSEHLLLTPSQEAPQRHRLDFHGLTAGQKKSRRKLLPVYFSIEPIWALRDAHRCKTLRQHLVGDVALRHLLHQQLIRDCLPLGLDFRLRLNHSSLVPLLPKSIGIPAITNPPIGRIRPVYSLYPISHLYDSVSNYWKH
jgi:hypothetical protein